MAEIQQMRRCALDGRWFTSIAGGAAGRCAWRKASTCILPAHISPVIPQPFCRAPHPHGASALHLETLRTPSMPRMLHVK